jgi:uncharacterized phage-associated protein
MSQIRFKFAPGKLVAAIAYFAQCGLPKLDKLKTVKLLYFADKEHLLKHGRPILGDVYFCMPHGPVPSYSKNIIDDTLDESDSESALLSYVGVDSSHKYARFTPKADADLGQFSASERAALDATIAAYGHMDPWALRNLTHKEPCWLIADETKPDGVGSVPMAYELFFEGQNAEALAILELAQEEQVDRDLVGNFFK